MQIQHSPFRMFEYLHKMIPKHMVIKHLDANASAEIYTLFTSLDFHEQMLQTLLATLKCQTENSTTRILTACFRKKGKIQLVNIFEFPTSSLKSHLCFLQFKFLIFILDRLVNAR